MLEQLSEKIDRALKKISGQGKISESNISETLREVRRILLDADVNYKVAKQFIEDVKEKALGKEVLLSVTPGQMITKIFNDELTDLMGGKSVELTLNPSGITKILMVGLQGSGKTTFSGKLANYLKQRKRKVLLCGADVYRPAAKEQLRLLAKQIDVQFFTIDDSTNALEISEAALKYASDNKLDTLIIDTAGRLHVDDSLMKEVSDIKEVIKPTETLFVVDSMTGQDAVNSAKAFHDRVDFDGIVLTKLDGDTRGGCALSIKAVVNKPIKFSSLGEKLDSIEVFHPDRLASRILGKGDVVSLVEKAQEAFDEKEAMELEQKIMNNSFDFNDFLKQLKMIKKMGSMKSILGMIPGLGNALKNAEIDDKQVVRVEAIVQSMTKIERANPKILNGSRRKRIARGSGNSIQDVNRLIKQFEEMQRMMKTINVKNKVNNNNVFKNKLKKFKYN